MEKDDEMKQRIWKEGWLKQLIRRQEKGTNETG